MQIVIDIPEELKNKCDELEFEKAINYVRWFDGTLTNAIKNGTVLPEHGDLVDRSEIEVEEDVYNQTYIIHAPTILEATKGDNG